MSQMLVKRPQAYTSAEVSNCVLCGSLIKTESTQKGIERIKCDSCIKETKRLVVRIRYWERKVFSTSRQIKTHCINGHEFTLENSVYRKDGQRTCRTCRNQRNRIYQQKTKQSLKYQYANKKSPFFRIRVSREEFEKIKHIIKREEWV